MDKLILILSVLLASNAFGENVAPYIAAFKRDLDTYQQINMGASQFPIDNLEVRFDPLIEGKLAVCLKDENSRALIFNVRYWDAYSEDLKTAIVYHELGHCVLNRDHDEQVIKIDGRTLPKSLMRPEAIAGTVFKKYREYYVKELFHPDTLPPEVNTLSNQLDALTTLLLPPHNP